MDEPGFPDPDEESGNRGPAKVFLLALALMIGLTIFIFNSGLWQALGKALLTTLGN